MAAEDDEPRPARGASDIGLASTQMSLLRSTLLNPSFVLIALILVFALVGATRSDHFVSAQTWINILRDSSFVAIAASFAAIVMIGGGLDLSVGSVLVAGAMMSAELVVLDFPVVVVIFLVLLLGGLLGLINGLLIGLWRISAIIVTLGTLFIFRATTIFAANSNPIGPLRGAFGSLGRGSIAGVPYLILIGVLVAGFAHVLLEKTTFGFNLRAVGGNREGARSTGINVRRIEVITYVLSGGAGAFVGLLQASWLGSGSPTLGTGFELKVIAAAVIGGTSIAGAVGTVSGAALGAVLLSVLGTGLVLLRVDAALQDVFMGVILVLAAALDRVRRRQMFRPAKNASIRYPDSELTEPG